VKTIFSLLSGLVLVGAIAVPAMAQVSVPPMSPPPRITHGEVDRFDKFLDAHPRDAAELRKNPALVDDPGYLAKHPKMVQYFKKHPGVREEIHQHPYRFMKREDKI
jgi:hypothetical protein